VRTVFARIFHLDPTFEEENLQSNVGEEDPEPKVSIGGAAGRRSPRIGDTPTETKMLAESTADPMPLRPPRLL